MLTLTDSFIEYLAANFTDAPVKWVHVTPDDETNRLTTDALNVTFLGTFQYDELEEALVSLDVIGTDERKVMEWVGNLTKLLFEQQYTAELNYSPDPASPVPTGQLVSWDADKVKFQVIEAASMYLQMNATFPICHARQP